VKIDGHHKVILLLFISRMCVVTQLIAFWMMSNFAKWWSIVLDQWHISCSPATLKEPTNPLSYNAILDRHRIFAMGLVT